ncbi:MAG: hypothetical protein DMG41_19120 [Acidobacteria bacterium]|nr:MAG: hypothetical protein AUH13_19735 [Acidobacteria bacterium 13_2_20CM_58_27]PYT66290.1 MAG: hypothetical protein DMG42_29660 [Acidobacteriota bacterium]PYT86622.1 MAG: hypothetical protein DMG41_19120 [Acidobacteriota bacterium]
MFQQAAVELTLPGIACEPGVLPAKFRKNDLPPNPSHDAGKLPQMEQGLPQAIVTAALAKKHA